MVGGKAPLAEASAAWRQALATAGFAKRKGDVHIRSISAETLGWLGLNRAVDRRSGLIEVNPVVGVRRQPLERAVADLLGEAFHQYIPPTVSTPPGYLMPAAKYRPWLLGGNVNIQDVVNGVIEAVELGVRRRWSPLARATWVRPAPDVDAGLSGRGAKIPPAGAGSGRSGAGVCHISSKAVVSFNGT